MIFLSVLHLRRWQLPSKWDGFFSPIENGKIVHCVRNPASGAYQKVVGFLSNKDLSSWIESRQLEKVRQVDKARQVDASWPDLRAATDGAKNVD